MRTVRLREEADQDLTAAASWYERQRPGLGHEFLAEALAAFQRVIEHPFSYPIVHNDMRRAPMARFPFRIYFRVEQSKLIVIAVIHARRHPQRWRSRR